MTLGTDFSISTSHSCKILIDMHINRGIMHDFSLISINQVPKEVLKTNGEAQGFQFQGFPRDLANVE